jgi:hypothetical protein
MQMNPCMHKANSLADIALAECKQYLPLIGCLSIVSISLYVVSGLNI